MLPHGFLLIDKPVGITSHDVVARLRKILQTKAIGHSGTLDPLASGLMVCLLNEATKVSSYILEGDKAYTVGVRFGVETDTLDITGEVTAQHAVPAFDDHFVEKVKQAALTLSGDFEWNVPLFSAKKINGKKLYDYARAGEDLPVVERPKKQMRFWDIQVDEITAEGAVFSLQCSKGSYVRQWVSELGSLLGYGACLQSLRRTWSKPYFVSQAITLDQLQKEVDSGGFFRQTRSFVNLADSLPHYKRIVVKGLDATLVSNGQIGHGLRNLLIAVFDPHQDEMVQIVEQRSGELKALIGLEPQKGFVIRRVFRY
ncbi:MAG: tRNA pseudouridine(55) synthase TruB [Pseudobdellovibrionaceae bacterium]